MKRDDLRQLAGLDYGWRRKVNNTKKAIVTNYRAIVFFAQLMLIYVLAKFGLARK